MKVTQISINNKMKKKYNLYTQCGGSSNKMSERELMQHGWLSKALYRTLKNKFLKKPFMLSSNTGRTIVRGGARGTRWYAALRHNVDHLPPGQAAPPGWLPPVAVRGSLKAAWAQLGSRWAGVPSQACSSVAMPWVLQRSWSTTQMAAGAGHSCRPQTMV